MENPTLDLPRFVVIGHRGAAGHEPENTLSSFAKAIELGAHMIELDVYNIQGHLIVHHDETLDRTTNGTGALIENNFDLLRTINAGKGQSIPTLDEVVRLVADRIPINIELKGPHTAQPVAQFIKSTQLKTNIPQRYLVSSFDHSQLRQFREADSTTPIAILAETFTPQLLHLASELSACGINLPWKKVTVDIINACHDQKLTLYAFTPNSFDAIDKMLALNVDGVFSDYPERALERCSS